MDRERLIENISRFAAARNESPSGACLSAGVGKNYVSELKRGKTPSVSSVADLAAYLGVSTSDLVGDRRPGADEAEARLLGLYDDLNEEGQERLIDYAEDLSASGRYKKAHSDRMGAEA